MEKDALSISSGAGCEAESWSPEVISLYGDEETIQRKMQNFEMDLPRRRIFVFTAEDSKREEVSFYERTAEDTVTVVHWTGDVQAGLHERIANAIIKNKGVNCVGEQTRAIISGLPGAKTTEDVAAPVNAKAAFSHSLRNFPDYARSTIYLMC